jgi:TolB protein
MNIPLIGCLAQFGFAITLCLLSGCSVVSEHGVQSVSIAPDDSSYVVTYRDRRESLLAVCSMQDNSPQILLQSKKGIRYERAVFSSDGKRLYFISREKKDEGNVFVVDIDGSNLTQLTFGLAFGWKGTQDIRDIIISHQGDKLYYTNSGFFGRYSPIASKQPHQMDVFSMNTDGTGLEQLSFGNHYALPGLSLSADGKEIYLGFGVLSLEKRGMFRLLEIESPERLIYSSEHPISEFVNNQFVLASGKVEERLDSRRAESKLPVGEFGAVYGSGLFLIDAATETVINEIAYLPSYLDNPALTHDGQRVLFIRNDTVYGGDGDKELWSVRTDGSELQRIKLPFEE